MKRIIFFTVSLWPLRFSHFKNDQNFRTGSKIMNEFISFGVLCSKNKRMRELFLSLNSNQVW
jgi:hypothetical protein